MVDVYALAGGIVLTLVVFAFHFARGTERSVQEDIADVVLERRAATVPKTNFPEPMSRAIGGGGAIAPAVGAGSGAEAELVEGESTTDESSPSDIPEDEVERFEISFEKEGEVLEIANNETILDATEDEGWDLPYACREGQCLSCGGHVVDGDAREYVIHDNQQMLDDDELEAGYILTCVAYPRASFTLETRETP